MTPSETSASSRRATLVAAYPTLQAARSASKALPRRHSAAVSLLWLEDAGSSGARGKGPASGRLAIEGSLLAALRTERTARAGLLGIIADELRRLGLLESSLDHYALHLSQGHAVLVAHGVESEIERVYRSVRRASLAVHHVSLD